MPDFPLPEKINTALLIVTAIGVFAAFWQVRASARSQRASFLNDLCNQLRTDSDAAEAFYLIEYAKFQYDNTFHGSELEKKIDRLLTMIDLICEMRAQKIISNKEMAFFEYQIVRVGADQQIQAYLRFLNDFNEKIGIQRRSFPAFQKHVKEGLHKSLFRTCGRCKSLIFQGPDF